MSPISKKCMLKSKAMNVPEDEALECRAGVTQTMVKVRPVSE